MKPFQAPLRGLLVVCIAFLAASLHAAESSVPARGPGKAAIASAYPLASDAGKEILAKGGNAFDAAVAVAAALAVVEPSSSGLGGGGFFLIRRASDGLEVMIDLREMAPGAASRDMYLDKDGNPVPGLSRDSALAAGIPGEPAGLAHLAKKYGKLPLAVSLQPAIKLAREGFPLYARLRGGMQFKKDAFLKTPDATRVYLVNGEIPEPGYVMKQPELAASLENLASKGADGFYKGAFAQKLVDGVKQLGGNWTLADLANYKVVERAPVVGQYRGARIVSGSPPTSGGVALIDALNILEGYDLGKLDRVTRTHLIVEAMRRMHRDRAVYLGDPDFVDVPVARLINKFYADGQRASIRMDKATPSLMLPGVDAPSPGPSTTHFSVLDKQGNMVGATITLNFFFGSGLMIPGTGILLNNQMDDFSVKPGVPNGFQLIGGDANAIAPEEAATVVEHPDLRRGAERAHDHRLARRQLHSGHGVARHAGLPGWAERGADRRRAAVPSPVLARRTAVRERCVQSRGAQGSRRSWPHAARRDAQVGQRTGGHLGLQDRRSARGLRSARRRRGPGVLTTSLAGLFWRVSISSPERVALFSSPSSPA